MKEIIETLEDLLALDSPATYDFKSQYKNEKYNINKYKTHFERFLHYKKDSPKEFDADGSGTNTEYVSKLIRSVYKELFLWNDTWDKQCSQYAKIESIHVMTWGPDTMNTFMMAPLPQFLDETTLLADYKNHEPNQRHISSKMLYEVIIKGVLNKTDTTSGRKSAFEDYFKDSYTSWEKLAGWIHTLGNFVLVPAGFNTERAKLFDDYWDKSLQYLSMGTEATSGLFNWYINHFFLWDYVDIVENTYRVKSLFNPKFFEFEPQEWYFDGQVRYPRHTKCEIMEWVENVSLAIERRGRLMVALLKLKSKDGELYKRLQTNYFDSNEVKGNMEEIVESICKKIQDKEIIEEFKACLCKKIE